MKSQFLKIAGVKSEKAFYKKYPTEAAFFKAHPEAKKMVNGGEQDKGQLKKLEQLTDFGNPPIAQYGYNLPNPFSFNQVNPSLNIQAPTSLGVQQPTAFGMRNATDTSKMFGNYQSGKNISAGFGKTGQAPSGSKASAIGKLAGSAISTGIDIANTIKAQKEAKRQAQQNAQLTGVFSQAARSTPKDIEKRQYVRPEDVIVQPNQLFPSYGVGTNILTAQDGAVINQIGGNPTEIMNTFAPNTIYSDSGYEPLGETDKLKAYYYGGKLETAQDGLDLSGFDFSGSGMSDALNSGGFADFMNAGGSNILTNLTSQVGSGGYGPTAGNKIGGTLGKAAGTIFGGPIGGKIGEALGSTVGGLIDPTGRQIKKYNLQSERNVNDIVGIQFGKGIHGQYGNVMEDGGDVSDEYKWVSHSWQPQVIAKFGDYSMDELLSPPKDADMLRTGGHIRQNYMFEPDEQFALGGDLKVYRGEAEHMSHNPYLPDGGETVMFRGPSHDDGGMPIKYGDSPVEVEGGEPAVKLRDGGTGDTNLNVYGNLQISKLAADEIGDSKAKGMKYKNYVAQLSKQEAKANKKIDKASEFIDDSDIRTPFDKLKFSSMQANILGGNMQLKDIAEKKMNAAAVQNAINDTAEELGLEADALAKNQIKEAKKGANIKKAATGIELNDKIQGLLDLLDKKGYSNKVSSTIREGAKTAQGRASRHASGEAADVVFPQLGEKAYETILKDPDIATFLLENGLTAINEYDPNTLSATKGTGPHIHFGYDKGTAASDKFRDEAKQLYGDIIPKPREFGRQSGLPGVSAENFMYLKGLYEEAKQQKKGPAVEKFQREFSRVAPDYAKKVLSGYPTTTYGKEKGYKATQLESNYDQIFGPRTERYMASLNIEPAKGVGISNQGKPSTTPLTPFPSTITPPTTGQTTTKSPFPWIPILNQIIPNLRPSDRENLDPNQLLGEMYALSTNQLEPVYAQKYQPQLLTPYDISYQDQLNEVTAQTNAAMRRAAGDPAALAAISAQADLAKSKVLGEQFRANQAMKNQIYNQNIGTLNDAQLKNLAILSEQADKQARAKSATKATTQEALNSISAKIAQNKLENRTLQTYENLYNYRYDPNFRAQNYNPLVDFQQMIDVAKPSTAVTKTTTDKQGNELLPIYNKKGETTGYKVKESKNGSIVRALKNF